MSTVINHGTPSSYPDGLKDHTLADAWANMGEFASQLVAAGVQVTRLGRRGHQDDPKGWYAFRLFVGSVADQPDSGKIYEIDMPGVRSVQLGSVLSSPRLYINGNSWYWGVGLGMIGTVEQELPELAWQATLGEDETHG